MLTLFPYCRFSLCLRITIQRDSRGYLSLKVSRHYQLSVWHILYSMSHQTDWIMAQSAQLNWVILQALYAVLWFIMCYIYVSAIFLLQHPNCFLWLIIWWSIFWVRTLAVRSSSWDVSGQICLTFNIMTMYLVCFYVSQLHVKVFRLSMWYFV